MFCEYTRTKHKSVNKFTRKEITGKHTKIYNVCLPKKLLQIKRQQTRETFATYQADAALKTWGSLKAVPETKGTAGSFCGNGIQAAE
jgi:hypothetical protein